MGRHIHLDPLGGIAGDMFAAAVLDAFPTLGDGLITALRDAGLARDVSVRWEAVVGEILTGSRFVVDDPRERGATRPHSSILVAGHAGHDHVPFSDIRDRIKASGLAAPVVARALDIFTHLARAEATVHGVSDLDSVVLHEVGAQDSVADIVAAAWLIERVEANSWSCGSLPLGSGTVNTAHGTLPIPAPATSLLLEGIAVHDDGRPGERVTPTGAAIVKHLAPSTLRPRGKFGRMGIGWGTKRFVGLPNILRLSEIVLERALLVDRVCALSFEIDDQPAEDLAIGLDRIRAIAGVVDVVQAPVFGKKGRMTSSVRVLCVPEEQDAVVRACLTETTTLGVRVEIVDRVVLLRDERTVDGLRVKSARRPDGTVTEKVDVDDLAKLDGAAARRALKNRVERA